MIRQAIRFAALVLVGLEPAQSAQAGAWVLPDGRSYLQLKFLHQQTDERYFLEGERIPYFFDGRSRIDAIFLDFNHGFWKRLEAKLQVPLFRIRFDDIADDRTSDGLGDVRAGLRWGVSEEPVVATLGFGVKLPTGRFENDAEVVPVGEGQLDYDLTAELARSLWPRPGYVTALVGYRLRTANQENGIDHGDELFWSVEVGYEPLNRLMVKLVARGLHGERSTAFGLELPTLRREAVYIEPGLILRLGPGRGLEVSVPFTVRGRNWPAGPVLSVGFSQRF